LVVEFCKRLGDDFKGEVIERLLKDDNTEDEFKEFKKFEDIMFPSILMNGMRINLNNRVSFYSINFYIVCEI